MTKHSTDTQNQQTLLKFIKNHVGTFKGTANLVREIRQEYMRLYKHQGLSISEETIYRKLRTPYKDLEAKMKNGRGFMGFIAAVSEATGISFELQNFDHINE